MSWLTRTLLAFAPLLFSGCSMCANGYLEDYATVGGKWQRTNPTTGRVGSILSDAGTTLTAGTAGERIVDGAPATVESEFFGEACTDDYWQSTEQFQDLGTAPLDDQSLELHNGSAPLMLGED